MPARTPTAAGRRSPDGQVTVPELLASNVRVYRLLRRLEQEDVADRMRSLGHKWRRATVSEVERARRNVTVDELLALVAVLGASVTQLLDSRGPGGRSGPRVALPVKAWGEATGDTDDWLDLDPAAVGALICSHQVYAESVWTHGRFQGFDFTPGRTDLTDVGPEGETP